MATFVALVTRVTAASKSASNMSTVILMTIVTKAVTKFVTLVSVPDVNDPACTSSMTARTVEMFVKISYFATSSACFSAAVKAAGTMKVERSRLISPVERLIWRMSRDANGRVNPVSRARLA